MTEMEIDHESYNGAASTVEAGQANGKQGDIDQDFQFDFEDNEILKPENPWSNAAAPVQLYSAKNADMDELSKDMHRQLILFYRHFFPHKQYYDWLNYNNSPKPTRTFMHREFTFTLADGTYIRFQSFKNMEELKSEIERIRPAKIDIGAVYNIKPKDKSSVRANAFVPVTKELVFDIDMTDYDEIRTCCSGGDVCMKCWSFMTVAMKVIDAALREDFGFKHILWVYSGRRGVHCWVADERARVLTNEQRKAIVSYIEVIKDQEILTEPKNWEKILAIIPEESVKAKIRAKWEEDPDCPPPQKWSILMDVIEESVPSSKNKYVLEKTPRDIIFQYTYPRLDDKVSMDIKHLLKSPFCTHPKTGRVCVPIPIETCEDFDPSFAPTVPQLVKELNEYDAQHPDKINTPGWGKTSLREYVEIFEEFVKGIKKDIAEKKSLERRQQE
ncbi:hypothetical protein BGZ76_007485 [Entomortierella beljakovae]|nr:hypothetical protein BGZ76_007485 [Entomortierella beljakovae]